MTSPISLPAPAERLPRAAVKRRAIQLALLLAGLIGIGFLCGGQAHADDSAGPLASRHAAVREAAAEPVREVRAVPGRASGEVRARVVEPVREKAVRPAADAVRQVTEPVGEVAGRVVEGLAQASPRPLPDGPPTLPELPGLPGHSGSEPTPADPTEPTEPAEAQPAHTSVHEHGPHRAARPHGSTQAGPTAYDTARFGDVRRDGAHRASPARHAAAPQPAGPGTPSRPDGAPVANASAGDGGSTRHGDLHAAAFDSRLPVLLPPGALASGGPAPVTDRHRDIPEFPG
ncbi:hypothetical protein ACVHNB_04095 [Streptomyces sp. YJ-C3]